MAILKRCPFCGGKANVVEADYYCFYSDESDLTMQAVQCEQCYSCVEAETVEQAITKWNTRSPIERIIDRLNDLFEDESRIKFRKTHIVEIIEDEAY